MITWSRARTLAAGTALILVTNAVALVGVSYNRSGAPDSLLHLTQRELALPWAWPSRHENSGLSLTLRWRVLGREDDMPLGAMMYYPGVGGAPPWLDRDKLAELGFDISRDKDAPPGRKHEYHWLDKEVFLVLEMDGPAYREALRRAGKRAAEEEALAAANPGNKEFAQRANSARERLTWEEKKNSRLFVVDAGLDAPGLRAKYPDAGRYAILRGRVVPRQIREGKTLHLSGHVMSLDIDDVNVPHGLRPALESGFRKGVKQDGASYRVTLAIGKRFEPWIVSAAGGEGASDERRRAAP